MAKRKPSSPSKKKPRSSSRPPVRKPPKGGPSLLINFVSIEVLHNGWPGTEQRETDLSIILQIENPSGAGENRVLASERLPFRARSGQTVASGDLSPGANGVPFFRGRVAVSDHVNLHARLFIERTNAVGPILGAALNTVVGEAVGKIPLLAEPVKDVLHIQIGKTIATELARATAIVPVDKTMAGSHTLTVALVSPRTIPGIYAPPGSPEGYKKGVVATEGQLAALLRLELELKLV